jgi:hypothetical protein
VDPCEALVIDAIQQLIEDELAEWQRTEQGELELRLATGETFLVSDAGITSR